MSSFLLEDNFSCVPRLEINYFPRSLGYSDAIWGFECKGLGTVRFERQFGNEVIKM